MYKTLQSFHKEIQNLKHEQELADQDIRRKNDDLLREQENKDKIERNIDAIAQQIAQARDRKLHEEEFIRRTLNSNNLLQLKIEQIRCLI